MAETSSKFTARTDLLCPQCGAPLALRSSRYGLFYGCTAWSSTRCKGALPARSNGVPLGLSSEPISAPAAPTEQDKLKALRSRAHALLDQLWKPADALMDRSDAYRWMCSELDIPEKESSVAKMDRRMLLRLIELLEKNADDLGIDVTQGLD